MRLADIPEASWEDLRECRESLLFWGNPNDTPEDRRRKLYHAERSATMKEAREAYENEDMDALKLEAFQKLKVCFGITDEELKGEK